MIYCLVCTRLLWIVRLPESGVWAFNPMIRWEQFLLRTWFVNYIFNNIFPQNTNNNDSDEKLISLMTFSHLEENFKESIRRLGGIQNKFEGRGEGWDVGVSLEAAHLILCLCASLYFAFRLSLLIANFHTGIKVCLCAVFLLMFEYILQLHSFCMNFVSLITFKSLLLWAIFEFSFFLPCEDCWICIRIWTYILLHLEVPNFWVPFGLSKFLCTLWNLSKILDQGSTEGVKLSRPEINTPHYTAQCMAILYSHKAQPHYTGSLYGSMHGCTVGQNTRLSCTASLYGSMHCHTIRPNAQPHYKQDLLNALQCTVKHIQCKFNQPCRCTVIYK